MITGRTTKFTPETIDKLCEAFKLGATIDIACGYAGISDALYYEWQSAGLKNEKPEMVDFVDRIKAAKSSGAIDWLSRIEEASKEQWQAAAWKLERRYFRDYSANPIVRQEFKELEEKVKALEEQKKKEEK